MAWLAGYDYRKKITVQVAFLDAAQVNFPLYVPIIADADIGARCMANGYDIRFTMLDGTTLLSYERESFIVAGGAATGIFWVKSDLATAPATEIYCYYGVAGQPNVSNGPATFSAYTRVWHLQEPYSTGVGNYKDALGVGPLTLTDLDGDSSQADGIVGKCIDLAGDADYLTDVDSPDHDPGGTMTIELWNYFDIIPVAETGLIIHDISNFKWFLTIVSAPLTRFYIRTASGISTAISNTPLNINNWYYFVGIYDKTLPLSRTKLYINSLIATPANGFNEDIIAGDEGIVLGGRWVGRYINGRYDEVRYSKDSKSASWIKFVYYNITEPDNELTWGAEETQIVFVAPEKAMIIQPGMRGYVREAAGISGRIGSNPNLRGYIKNDS